jgi:tRNA-(ms[2]io[6]A)-hydroxylase
MPINTASASDMTSSFALGIPSRAEWVTTVLADFDHFLLDHAANERKASAMAMSMVAHYPNRARLVSQMIDLALEEMNHFRQVYRIIEARGLSLADDEKDPYVNQLRQHFQKGSEAYFLDRLLASAVIEARGAERFGLLAQAIEDPKTARFYEVLARSEAEHEHLFIDLAKHYFDHELIRPRLDYWLEIEAEILASLPITARLH